MIIWVLAFAGLAGGGGQDGAVRCARVGAGSTCRPGADLVGAGCLGSARVQGVESAPRGDDVGGPTPAGWDLEDSLAGVGDVAGGGAQQPEPQGLGFGSGEVSIEGELA